MTSSSVSKKHSDSSVSLVTGGCGFIGSNLVNRLLSKGERVVVLDNLSRLGSKKNAQWLKAKFGRKFSLVQGDVRDFKTVSQVAKNACVIYHLAAQVAVTTSVYNPREDFEINALGTFNVLEAGRTLGKDPVILYDYWH